MVEILENAQEKSTYLTLVFAKSDYEILLLSLMRSPVYHTRLKIKKKEATRFGYEFASVIILDVFSYFHWNRRQTTYPYPPSAWPDDFVNLFQILHKPFHNLSYTLWTSSGWSISLFNLFIVSSYSHHPSKLSIISRLSLVS